MGAIRLVIDGTLTGGANMARDEALLTLVGERRVEPTLRLYQWSPPTISLGYFQSYADYEKLPPPAGELAVVRRLTGGGAILHDRELTYSLTLPIDHPLLAGGPNRLYEIMHDAIIDSLGLDGLEAKRCGTTRETHHRDGPFFCFARRHCLDVLVGDQKIAGSAQRRTKTAVLQHGSIVIERRFEQQEAAQIGPFTAQRVAQLCKRLPLSLTKVTGMEVRPASWSAEELELADALYAKYAGSEWTQRF